MDDREEIKVLKAQLQTMRENDKCTYEVLRNGVYLLVATAALLVGYGWWNNTVNSRRQLETLRDELANDVHEAELRLEKYMVARHHEMSTNHVAQLNAILESHKVATSKEIQWVSERHAARIAFETGHRMLSMENYTSARTSGNASSRATGLFMCRAFLESHQTCAGRENVFEVRSKIVRKMLKLSASRYSR